MRLPTGCDCLDELLDGGVETGTVTQFYGVPGSGKTNLILQLAVNTIRAGHRAIFIDTEGFSADRFKQIAGEDAIEVAQRIIVLEPTSFDEQHTRIKEVEKLVSRMSDARLILVDSLTTFYRYEMDETRGIQLKRELASQVAFLLGMARKHDIAVVVTNQVYVDVETDQIRPVGGIMLEHLSKAIVELERLRGSRRRAVIKKHRSRPEGASCEFEITAKGLC